jgi:hypothetical protein
VRPGPWSRFGSTSPTSRCHDSRISPLLFPTTSSSDWFRGRWGPVRRRLGRDVRIGYSTIGDVSLTAAGFSDWVGMIAGSPGKARSSACLSSHPSHKVMAIQRQLSENRNNGNIGHHPGGRLGRQASLHERSTHRHRLEGAMSAPFVSSGAGFARRSIGRDPGFTPTPAQATGLRPTEGCQANPASGSRSSSRSAGCDGRRYDAPVISWPRVLLWKQAIRARDTPVAKRTPGDVAPGSVASGG